MTGKIQELEDIRAEVEGLQVGNENFVSELLQLFNRTSKRLSEVDDQQEINWTAKSHDIAMRLKGEKVQKNTDEQKDLALTYLKEALDSVIIREKRYLE